MLCSETRNTDPRVGQTAQWLRPCQALAETQVQFPAPMQVGSQPPLNPALGGPESFGLQRYLHSFAHIHTQTIHTIKDKNKCENENRNVENRRQGYVSTRNLAFTGILMGESNIYTYK